MKLFKKMFKKKCNHFFIVTSWETTDFRYYDYDTRNKKSKAKITGSKCAICGKLGKI